MQENALKIDFRVKKQVCFESIPSFTRQMYKFILKRKFFEKIMLIN